MAFTDFLRRAWKEISEVLRPRDAQFADLLIAQADCAAGASAALLAYLAAPSQQLAQEIADLEERGDRIQTDIQRALREALVTPLSGGDINHLGNAMDDLLDQFEDMVQEDAALAAAGIATPPYREQNFEALVAQVGAAVSLLPTAVTAILREPRAAEQAIADMRAAYNAGKRAYSLAYAALVLRGAHEDTARPGNQLRWLRLHLRRVEKLTNLLSGILANG